MPFSALASVVLTLQLSVFPGSTAEESKYVHKRIRAADWLFEEFSIHITVMAFLVLVILLKMAYHKMRVLAAYVPESLLLIVAGAMFGALIHYSTTNTNSATFELTPGLFFQFLLPPIVLDSAYNLYNRTFAEYLGTILIYAVLGTIINFLLIGFLMHGLALANCMGAPALDLDVKGYLLFSSLIVAVDPVAVLAIFQDIGVDLALYYMVFGESLLNDAITVVLYHIMEAFADEEAITGAEVAIGVASFFTVSLGGLLVGVIVGVSTCFFTRVDSSMAPIIVLLLGYFAYIFGDMVGWSGIISMIGCGLIQAAYAFHNLNRDSVDIVKQVTHIVAELSEAVIFLFIGIQLFRDNLLWHTGFNVWALVLCLISRVIAVLFLTGLINYVLVDGLKISWTEQFIVMYGGLRGAVAFSLAVLVDARSLGEADRGRKLKNILVTATLWIILFTVGVMGMTMKPLVRLLKIKMASHAELSLFDELQNAVLDSALAGIETITGEKGRNVVREFFLRIDDNYIRHILQRNPETHDQKIVKVYEKMALKLHYATIQPNQSSAHLANLPEVIKSKYIKLSRTTGNLATLHKLPDNLVAEPGAALSATTSAAVAATRSSVSEGEEGDEVPASRVDTSAVLVPCYAFQHIPKLTEAVLDASVVVDSFRSARRLSLPDGWRHQQDFRRTLITLMRSKGLALAQRSMRRRKNSGHKSKARRLFFTSERSVVARERLDTAIPADVEIPELSSDSDSHVRSDEMDETSGTGKRGQLLLRRSASNQDGSLFHISSRKRSTTDADSGPDNLSENYATSSGQAADRDKRVQSKNGAK